MKTVFFGGLFCLMTMCVLYATEPKKSSINQVNAKNVLWARLIGETENNLIIHELELVKNRTAILISNKLDANSYKYFEFDSIINFDDYGVAIGRKNSLLMATGTKISQKKASLTDDELIETSSIAIPKMQNICYLPGMKKHVLWRYTNDTIESVILTDGKLSGIQSKKFVKPKSETLHCSNGWLVSTNRIAKDKRAYTATVVNIYDERPQVEVIIDAPQSAIYVSDAVIYIGTESGTIYCYDMSKRQIKLLAECGTSRISSIAIDKNNENIFISTINTRLDARNLYKISISKSEIVASARLEGAILAIISLDTSISVLVKEVKDISILELDFSSFRKQ